MEVEFFREIFEKYSNMKFHENPSSGSRVFPCGRTDRETDMTIFFYIIHTVVLIQYIYLLEISVQHNNYCRSYSLNIRTLKNSFYNNCCVGRIFLTNKDMTNLVIVFP